MRVIIIGCGNIGLKRIDAISKIHSIEIVCLIEKNPNQKAYLNDKYQYEVYDDYKQFLVDDSIDAFIICTPTHPALSIIEDALKAGKNVLCEKPLGDNASQTQAITDIANKRKVVLQVGFNIRHDAGLQKAKSLIEDQRIGKPYYLKCTYVNGSVLTNENKVGALLDMGIHNIYLAKLFMGDIKPITSAIQRYEYPIKDKDDNGFALIQSKDMVGSIHFSLVRWKNDFKLEVTGSEGSVVVESLTKWGNQTTTLYERKYPSGSPKEKKYTYKGDDTWEKELHEFYKRVTARDLRNNNEALEAMQIAESIRNISIT